MGTASHARGGPSPEIPSGSLFDKQSTWLQRYDRLMEAPDPLTGVKVKLHVLPGGHVVPIMEATSIIQAGLESVHERAPSMLEDVGPSSHIKASLGLGAPEADADCMPLHSLNRQASFSHEADIDTHGCFQTHTEVWHGNFDIHACQQPWLRASPESWWYDCRSQHKAAQVEAMLSRTGQSSCNVSWTMLQSMLAPARCLRWYLTARLLPVRLR